MVDATGRGQAHDDEARQRHGFQISAASRLHHMQDLQTLLDAQLSDEPKDRIQRRGVKESGLADSD